MTWTEVVASSLSGPVKTVKQRRRWVAPPGRPLAGGSCARGGTRPKTERSEPRRHQNSSPDRQPTAGRRRTEAHLAHGKPDLTRVALGGRRLLDLTVPRCCETAQIARARARGSVSHRIAAVRPGTAARTRGRSAAADRTDRSAAERTRNQPIRGRAGEQTGQ